MSQTLEHIKQEIKALRPAERFDLWRNLGQEFDPPMVEGDDEKSVEAAWDAEIDARVKEIEEGKAELVSADDAIQRVRSRLAAHRADRTCCCVLRV
jgi:putative addiction module component (TIGR02574 family)